MADEKDEEKKPSPLEEFVRKSEATQAWIDTLQAKHEDAFKAARDAHLLDKTTGQFYRRRLNDEDVQRKFTDTMVDFYVTEARAKLGVKEDTTYDAQQENLLLMTYAGVTREELLGLVRREKSNYWVRKSEIANALSQRVGERLRPGDSAHIRPEHKEGIIKELGLEGRVDPTRISVEELVEEILPPYVNPTTRGTVPGVVYEGKHYHIKPEAKKAA